MDLSLTAVDRLSLTVDTFSCLSKIRGVAPLLFMQADGSKTQGRINQYANYAMACMGPPGSGGPPRRQKIYIYS
jgi:hypothetical protein